MKPANWRLLFLGFVCAAWPMPSAGLAADLPMNRAEAMAYVTGVDNAPSMTVQAQAREDAVPDFAVIRLMIRTEAQDSDQATDDNARATKAVFDQAASAGIASSDIKTEDLTLRPVFEEEKAGAGNVVHGKQKGYRTDHVLKIAVRDPARAGALASALIRAGANNVLGVTFGVEKREEITDRLRAIALEAAQRQAKIYADAAGVRLGRVLRVMPQTEILPLALRADYRVFGKDDASAVPLKPGIQTIEVNVGMTWELLPK